MDQPHMMTQHTSPTLQHLSPHTLIWPRILIWPHTHTLILWMVSSYAQCDRWNKITLFPDTLTRYMQHSSGYRVMWMQIFWPEASQQGSPGKIPQCRWALKSISGIRLWEQLCEALKTLFSSSPLPPLSFLHRWLHSQLIKWFMV